MFPCRMADKCPVVTYAACRGWLAAEGTVRVRKAAAMPANSSGVRALYRTAAEAAPPTAKVTASAGSVWPSRVRARIPTTPEQPTISPTASRAREEPSVARAARARREDCRPQCSFRITDSDLDHPTVQSLSRRDRPKDITCLAGQRGCIDPLTGARAKSHTPPVHHPGGRPARNFSICCSPHQDAALAPRQSSATGGKAADYEHHDLPAGVPTWIGLREDGWECKSPWVQVLSSPITGFAG